MVEMVAEMVADMVEEVMEAVDTAVGVDMVEVETVEEAMAVEDLWVVDMVEEAMVGVKVMAMAVDGVEI